MQNTIDSINNDVDEIRNILFENIQKMLGNHESLDELLEKAENLRYQSRLFKKRSYDLYETQQPWYKRRAFILKCALAGVVLVASLSIIALAASGTISLHAAITAALFLFASLVIAYCVKDLYEKSYGLT